jgi:hypothetical protein
MRIRHLAVAAVLVAAGSGCFAGAKPEVARQAVDRFHMRYDSAQFELVYAASDTALKAATSREEFLAFMTSVRRKLGPVRGSTPTGTNTMVGTNGTQITLAYRTEFARGTGTEQFVWRMRGDSAYLYGYNVNSTALVVN